MFQTQTDEHLIRANIWSSDLKKLLEFDLTGMKYVRMLEGFPDGDTFNIPSIGQAESFDYVENEMVKFSPMDTGNFTFSVTEYKQSGHYITDKMKQNSFYTSQLVSSFVPKQHRAIMVAWEEDVFAIGPDNQTASGLNAINGGNHRFVATGTDQTLTIQDFSTAKFALRKAAVPMTNLVAVVDTSVAWELENLPNIGNLSNNPRWEGIVTTGISTGMQFIRNIHGFDVYVSDYLKNGMSETIDGTAVTNGVANLFFSATQDILPFIGLWRQQTRVESVRNVQRQRDEYVTTARWGVDLLFPENLVVILSDNSRVG